MSRGDIFVESLKAKFPRVFSGVGKLKNYKLKLHIDSQMTPLIERDCRYLQLMRYKKV